MGVSSKPMHRSLAKSRYHSRLGVILAKEFGDIFKRSATGWGLLVLAMLAVPAILYIFKSGDYSAPGSLGEYARSPVQSDGIMRQSFAMMLLGMAGTFGPVILPVMSMRDNAGTLEPLLVTATRRWELFAGRVLAFGIFWMGIGIVLAAVLGAAPQIPAVVSWCPFLSYFHPNGVFALKFILIWTINGALMLTAAESVAYLNTVRSVKLFGLALSAAAMVALAVPKAWLFAAFVPIMSGLFGIQSVFNQLPYNADVHIQRHTSLLPSEHPHFWILSIVGALTTTIVLTTLMALSRQDGGLLLKAAAKRKRRGIS